MLKKAITNDLETLKKHNYSPALDGPIKQVTDSLQDIAEEQKSRREVIRPYSAGETEKCKCSHMLRYHTLEFNGKRYCKYCGSKCKGFELGLGKGPHPWNRKGS